MIRTTEHHHCAQVAEAIGLIVIILLMFAVMMVRFGRTIHWSFR